MESWIILLALSTVILAIGNVIKKHVLKHEHPLELLAAEAPFRIFFILFLLPFVQLLSLVEYVLIFLVSLVLIATQLSELKAYRHMPISAVAPFKNLSPLILIVFSALLLGELITGVQGIGIGLIVLGGYALELRGKNLLEPLKQFRNYGFGLVFLLIILSIMGLLDKAMLDNANIPVVSYLFYLYLFTAVASLGMDWKKYGLAGVRTDWRKGWYWLALISITTILNIGLFYAAISLPEVLIVLAIPIRRTATLIETVIGGSLFHEEGIWRKTIATLIMIIGILFIL